VCIEKKYQPVNQGEDDKNKTTSGVDIISHYWYFHSSHINDHQKMTSRTALCGRAGNF
jgi:hypothetical protein